MTETAAAARQQERVALPKLVGEAKVGSTARASTVSCYPLSTAARATH